MSVSRTIVLVGGTSGLGRRAAEHLHESGHRLFVVGRDPKRARDLQRRLPTAIVFHGTPRRLQVSERSPMSFAPRPISSTR
jgi:short-subunit dehydrogenase